MHAHVCVCASLTLDIKKPAGNNVEPNFLEETISKSLKLISLISKSTKFPADERDYRVSVVLADVTIARRASSLVCYLQIRALSPISHISILSVTVSRQCRFSSLRLLACASHPPLSTPLSPYCGPATNASC